MQRKTKRNLVDQEKIDLKTKMVVKDKEGLYIMIKA